MYHELESLAKPLDGAGANTDPWDLVDAEVDSIQKATDRRVDPVVLDELREKYGLKPEGYVEEKYGAEE